MSAPAARTLSLVDQYTTMPLAKSGKTADAAFRKGSGWSDPDLARTVGSGTVAVRAFPSAAPLTGSAAAPTSADLGCGVAIILSQR
jgi:hypothetical protein